MGTLLETLIGKADAHGDRPDRTPVPHGGPRGVRSLVSALCPFRTPGARPPNPREPQRVFSRSDVYGGTWLRGQEKDENAVNRRANDANEHDDDTSGNGNQTDDHEDDNGFHTATSWRWAMYSSCAHSRNSRESPGTAETLITKR